MRAVINAFRRNPDIVALLVLCLTVNITRPSATSSAWIDAPQGMRIHRIFIAPVDRTMDALTNATCDSISNACDRFLTLDF